MGLDTVELVMEVEEAFNISIPDVRASQILTVGDLYDYIIEKLPSANSTSDVCLTAATFYQLRRHLREIDSKHSLIRPKTKLNHAIPVKVRRSHWKALSTLMDLRFPGLRRPSWLTFLACLLGMIVVFALILCFAKFNIIVGIIIAFVIGGSTLVLLMYLTQPFARYPTPTTLTIGDLVTNLVAMNYSKLALRYSVRNPVEVWNNLQLIICEQLGVDRSVVVPRARFVQDLGAD